MYDKPKSVIWKQSSKSENQICLRKELFKEEFSRVNQHHQSSLQNIFSLQSLKKGKMPSLSLHVIRVFFNHINYLDWRFGSNTKKIDDVPISKPELQQVSELCSLKFFWASRTFPAYLGENKLVQGPQFVGRLWVQSLAGHSRTLKNGNWFLSLGYCSCWFDWC